MEKESFESDKIAELLNQHFVPIKVDREERPDVDRVYMSFVTAISGLLVSKPNVHPLLSLLLSTCWVTHLLRWRWLANVCLLDSRADSLLWWNLLPSE